MHKAIQEAEKEKTKNMIKKKRLRIEKIINKKKKNNKLS